MSGRKPSPQTLHLKPQNEAPKPETPDPEPPNFPPNSSLLWRNTRNATRRDPDCCGWTTSGDIIHRCDFLPQVPQASGNGQVAQDILGCRVWGLQYDVKDIGLRVCGEGRGLAGAKYEAPPHQSAKAMPTLNSFCKRPKQYARS